MAPVAREPTPTSHASGMVSSPLIIGHFHAHASEEITSGQPRSRIYELRPRRLTTASTVNGLNVRHVRRRAPERRSGTNTFMDGFAMTGKGSFGPALTWASPGINMQKRCRSPNKGPHQEHPGDVGYARLHLRTHSGLRAGVVKGAAGG